MEWTHPSDFDMVVVTWRGEAQNLIEWSRKLGIPRDTLASRIDTGWSIDEAMTTPVRKHERRFKKVA